MYSPALETLLIDARIEDLLRARGTLILPRRGRDHRNRGAAARWRLRRRGRLRGLEVTGASSATWSQRS